MSVGEIPITRLLPREHEALQPIFDAIQREIIGILETQAAQAQAAADTAQTAADTAQTAANTAQTAANAAQATADSVTSDFDDLDNPSVAVALDGDIGFFGATPASRPTISGSRGGNVALADLITKLETLGILEDSTT